MPPTSSLLLLGAGSAASGGRMVAGPVGRLLDLSPPRSAVAKSALTMASRWVARLAGGFYSTASDVSSLKAHPNRRTDFVSPRRYWLFKI